MMWMYVSYIADLTDLFLSLTDFAIVFAVVFTNLNIHLLI